MTNPHRNQFDGSKLYLNIGLWMHQVWRNKQLHQTLVIPNFYYL